MAKEGKITRSNREKVERLRDYAPSDACALLKACARKGFDESVDIAINLNVDPRHADQMVRGAIVLPNGTGKTNRVLVFARGDKEQEARDAGADFVGSDDIAQKIQDGWLEFDTAIATPDMMGVVGRLGRILGPRGLMPNPRVGTVTMDVGKAVADMKAGRVEFRVDKAGIIHTILGKASFSEAQLEQNMRALIAEIVRLKPAAAKGIYMKRVTISSTMGPGIRVDASSLV